MGRKLKQGIDYYPMESDHTYNKKIRLLVNDKSGDGYWVWSCLLDATYKNKGYYFDLDEVEEFELFCSEHCKRPVDFVKEVIETALQRKLFNKDIYERTNKLTSDRIQINFLYGTYDRRRKGTQIFLQKRLLDLSLDKFHFSSEKSNTSVEGLIFNVCIVDANDVFPLKDFFFPRNNGENPRPSTHRREEKDIFNKEINKESSPKTPSEEILDFSEEKKIKKIQGKIAPLGDFEIEIIVPKESWQEEHIRRFIAESEKEFESITMTDSLFRSGIGAFQTILQRFVKMIQDGGKYQQSHQLNSYFPNWIETHREKLENILNPKPKINGSHSQSSNKNDKSPGSRSNERMQAIINTGLAGRTGNNEK
jgi:hypothetical protein